MSIERTTWIRVSHDDVTCVARASGGYIPLGAGGTDSPVTVERRLGSVTSNMGHALMPSRPVSALNTGPLLQSEDFG